MHVMFILFNDGTRPLQLLWFLLTIKDDSIEIIHYILSVAIYCIREMGLYINYILYELNVLYELLIPYLQMQRNKLETKLEESTSTNRANTKCNALKDEEDSCDIEIHKLDEILNGLLPGKFILQSM
eukprot:268934_1